MLFRQLIMKAADVATPASDPGARVSAIGAHTDSKETTQCRCFKPLTVDSFIKPLSSVHGLFIKENTLSTGADVPGARKCDLKILAEELGETVNDCHKLKDLLKIILASKEYDEESAKEWINTIINERKEREEVAERRRQDEIQIAEQKRQEEIAERRRQDEIQIAE
ncbi:hypothetical protein AVEN_132583-1 [Araneus ventricosus]|uniref:Uncharacterized protein n=1 Tax=Araneus ventricosus TaxID=182803 RepID=A0A4Y2RUS6_ARAVE|nr:hypothetical protein AVEN_132583-1 [Araneus ventricosus]